MGWGWGCPPLWVAQDSEVGGRVSLGPQPPSLVHTRSSKHQCLPTLWDYKVPWPPDHPQCAPRRTQDLDRLQVSLSQQPTLVREHPEGGGGNLSSQVALVDREQRKQFTAGVRGGYPQML